MDKEFTMPKLAERERNFFNGMLPSTIEGKMYYIDLQWLADNDIATAVDKMQETYSGAEILRTIFAHVYDFVMSHNDIYRIFDDNTVLLKESNDDKSDAMTLSNITFEACFFISLCQFLYETTRIKGSTLKNFVLKYSSEDFAQKKPFNYRNNEGGLESGDPLISEERKFRKARHRILKKHPVYQKSREWSAMREASRHEWSFYFWGEKNDLVDVRMDEATKKATRERQKKQSEILSTLKSFRNLYNEIDDALNAPMEEKYIERLDNAAKKFCSKLKKIRYERYIELEKLLIEHIRRDMDFYGINLYRLEKEMKLYRITTDVNRLLCCNDEEQAERIIRKAMLAGNIVFPKLYELFSNLPNVDLVRIYTDTFLSFVDEVVRSSRLIIDKLVEDGVFGENWIQLFLKTTNELAETVLYDPAEINYSLAPESQREFQIYLLEPVDQQIAYKKREFCSQQFPLSKADPDDEI